MTFWGKMDFRFSSFHRLTFMQKWRCPIHIQITMRSRPVFFFFIFSWSLYTLELAALRSKWNSRRKKTPANARIHRTTDLNEQIGGHCERPEKSVRTWPALRQHTAAAIAFHFRVCIHFGHYSIRYENSEREMTTKKSIAAADYPLMSRTCSTLNFRFTHLPTENPPHHAFCEHSTLARSRSFGQPILANKLTRKHNEWCSGEKLKLGKCIWSLRVLLAQYQIHVRACSYVDIFQISLPSMMRRQNLTEMIDLMSL